MSERAHYNTAAPSHIARDGGPQETAHYIKTALEDLATLARAHHLDLLVYLLDMARQEAVEATSRTTHGPL